MTGRNSRPNIMFFMSDDHAAHAISCYGSRINQTPNLDRIANEGMRLDNCFCTNSICTPSRASILTGTYNHVNGVTTLATMLDNRLQTFPKTLQEAGYQTAIFGKWHLGTGPTHCPTGVDDNVGRMLDFLEAEGLADNTMVIYTSDQGFFLGDHGWYDKRFMYEESLRMPFLVRYPREIAAGSVSADMVLNVDFPALFLDLAGVPIPEAFQGHNFRAVLKGQTPSDCRQSMYSRYWMNEAHHNIAAHYGVRTHRYKLIYYYYYYDGCGQEGAHGTIPPSAPRCIKGHEPEWELFDLQADPHEMNNVVDDVAYAGVVKELRAELHRLQTEVGDERYCKDI